MKTTDFCPYELSKKLKECGFDEPCSGKYVDCPKDPTLFRRMGYQAWNLEEDEVIAPSLYEAQKWLREKKHLSVEPYANIVANFNYNIADLESFADSKGQGIGYESYECALAAGISASLELIKKGE